VTLPPAALPVAHIEVWSDIACPWCYIGKRRFVRALDTFEQRDRIEVTWRSYQLAPDTPAGLRTPVIDSLVEMKGMPAPQVRQMFEQVETVAAEVGIIVDFDTVISANTFDAHRVVHLAGDTDQDGASSRRDAVLEALFRAQFVEGAVVDDRDTLVRIAASAGMDAERTRAALDSDAASEAVRSDLLEARSLGVTGVPFFVANRAVAVSGAQPEEVFVALLRRAIDDVDATAGEAAPGGLGASRTGDGCPV